MLVVAWRTSEHRGFKARLARQRRGGRRTCRRAAFVWAISVAKSTLPGPDSAWAKALLPGIRQACTVSSVPRDVHIFLQSPSHEYTLLKETTMSHTITLPATMPQLFVNAPRPLAQKRKASTAGKTATLENKRLTDFRFGDLFRSAAAFGFGLCLLGWTVSFVAMAV